MKYQVFGILWTVFNLALMLVMGIVGIYLLWLVIKALRVYINSHEVREEKKATRKSLAEALRENRVRCKMTQEFVSETIGVSRQAVSKWETGLSVPDAGMLVRIAGALDTTVNDLLGEEEPEQGRDLAAELEALNRQLAEREERSRRRWRAFFAAVGILALWGAVMLAAGLIR